MGQCCQQQNVQRIEQILKEEDFQMQKTSTIDFSTCSIQISLQFLNVILNCNQCAIDDVNSIMPVVMNYTSLIKRKKKQLIQQNFNEKKFCCLLKDLQELNIELRNQINKWLCVYQDQKNYKIDHVLQIFSNNSTDIVNKKLKNKQNKQLIRIKNKFTRQAFIFQFYAFNNNFTVIFLGVEKHDIKVYGFNSNYKLLNTLSKNECLANKNILMKNAITKSKNQLLPDQLLENQKEASFIFITNQEENPIILCMSGYRTIQFWEKQNLSWNCQQTIDAQIDVQGLILNPQETKFISYGYYFLFIQCYKIQIIELQGQEWIIAQQISINYQVNPCFINNNSFVFKQLEFGFLERYDYEPEAKQFVRVKPNFISNYVNINSNMEYPCQFIKQTNMLFIGHGKNIYFFHLNEIGVLELQESIELKSKFEAGFARILVGGQYVVTGMERKQFSVLKLRNSI